MRSKDLLPPFALASLLAGALACRPVLAIGWGEFVVLSLLIVILLAPLLSRLYRYLAHLQDSHDKQRKEK